MYKYIRKWNTWGKNLKCLGKDNELLYFSIKDFNKWLMYFILIKQWNLSLKRISKRIINKVIEVLRKRLRKLFERSFSSLRTYPEYVLGLEYEKSIVSNRIFLNYANYSYLKEQN